ncbi:MAG: tRNA pseudouridine(55) synthase TruB [Oscillospiraceae bacterium]|nr:tRNA pseudouridine(55) synthase TruB [Oscillospiraceae bacterium]
MNGILLIDKPQDWTSNDVVSKLRGALHEKRVGHSGTLDPMATGLLVVFVGRATRAASFAEAHDKRYLASLRLGLETDTQDITGRTLREQDASTISEAQLREVFMRFTGAIEQIPPMMSAIKIGGRKLYEIARRGGEVERQPRPITVHALELLGREKGDWLLDIRCSKGTYVRTLCHDLGRALGCGGCMSALRRVEAGQFSLAEAHPLQEVLRAADEGRAESLLLPVDSLFSDAPTLSVDEEGERRIRCGNELRLPELPDGQWRVYAPDGAFLAFSRSECGVLTTIKSFFEV